MGRKQYLRTCETKSLIEKNSPAAKMDFRRNHAILKTLKSRARGLKMFQQGVPLVEEVPNKHSQTRKQYLRTCETKSLIEKKLARGENRFFRRNNSLQKPRFEKP